MYEFIRGKITPLRAECRRLLSLALSVRQISYWKFLIF